MMRNESRNFKDSIKYFFLKYSLIPIVISLILFSISAAGLIMINIVINTKQANKVISEKLQDIYKSYYEEINRLSESDNLKNYIKTMESSNLVFDEYYKFNNKQEVKSVFQVIDLSNNFIISTAYTDSDFDTEGFILKRILPKIRENDEETIVDYKSIKFRDDSTAITFSRAIKDEGEIIGYAVLMVYKSPLESILFIKNNELSVVTDKHNTVLLTTNNSVKGLVSKFTPEYVHGNDVVEIESLENGKYFIEKHFDRESGLNVYTLNSVEIKFQLFAVYTSFIIIVVLLMWFLLNHLANKMSSENTKSIDKLVYAVNMLKSGDTTCYVDINTEDEFQVLAQEYNSMLDTLNLLMKKNEELSKLKYQSEMKLLQSQFNPHFIFNVLETLRYSLYIAPTDTEKIIIKLANLLRYSINYENEKVTLDKDIQYIKDFLELNKFRFGDRLIYSINISREAKGALVPKLLIQILVENSIKYGYIKKDKLEIKIIGEVYKEKLVLEVIDDGMGMDNIKVMEIQDMISKVENKSNHIGLHNLYRRLELFYGDSKEFKINSIHGEGTNIKISIPYEKGDNNV